MGKGEHANNQELQRHLVNTVLYLASSMVVRINKDSQGAHGRMSPLLVLESISDGPGGIRVKYHLGEDTYEALYGSEPKVYPLPTPLVMGYHGIRSQYVLNLTFHLGNLLAEGSCSLYFPTICVHGGLALERLFPKEKNRIRDAQYIISALLQLEKEEYLECRAHPDLDMAVAVDLYQDKIQEDEISPMRLERTLALCESLNGMQKNALNAKRRQVMQRLLNLNASRENIAKENPEFCTRITILAGARFLEKKKQLLKKFEH
jgi:hypothetical protein